MNENSTLDNKVKSTIAEYEDWLKKYGSMGYISAQGREGHIKDKIQQLAKENFDVYNTIIDGVSNSKIKVSDDLKGIVNEFAKQRETEKNNTSYRSKLYNLVNNDLNNLKTDKDKNTFAKKLERYATSDGYTNEYYRAAVVLVGSKDYPEDIEKMVKEVQQKTQKKVNNDSPKAAERTSNTATAATSQVTSKTTDNAQHSAQYNRMVSMIEHMNKINGPKKSVDAAATAQMIEQKFGDNAYDVLYKAIMEPTNYANALDAQNDKGEMIRLSREAVTHLANTDVTQVNDVTQKLLGNISGNTPQQTTEHYRPFANLQTNQKRMADLEKIVDLAIENPEQYAKTKELYQNLVENQLPGFEIATYFLELIKEVDAALSKLQEIQKNNSVAQNTSTEQTSNATLAKTAEEQKRKEDKTGFKKLYKEDPEKFAKAKDAYIASATNEATKESAEYYLGIISEIEQDDKLKKQMQKDAQNANAVAENNAKQIEKGAPTTQHSTATNAPQQTTEQQKTDNGKKIAFSRDTEGNPVYTLSGYGQYPHGGNITPKALYDGVYTIKADGQFVSYKSADGRLESTNWDPSKKISQALAQESRTNGTITIKTPQRSFNE